MELVKVLYFKAHSHPSLTGLTLGHHILSIKGKTPHPPLGQPNVFFLGIIYCLSRFRWASSGWCSLPRFHGNVTLCIFGAGRLVHPLSSFSIFSPFYTIRVLRRRENQIFRVHGGIQYAILLVHTIHGQSGSTGTSHIRVLVTGLPGNKIKRVKGQKTFRKEQQVRSHRSMNLPRDGAQVTSSVQCGFGIGGQ